MILRLALLALSLFQTCLSEPQFFHLPTATLENRLANGDPKCPIVAPRDPASCGGRTSQCWSPGVRDTDCPGHGLCCYDGCANICGGAPAPPPPPPPPRVVVPVPPPVPVVVVPRQPSNPCVPTPCGQGTTCTINAAGNAICNCLPGLIPKPDTITGCGPECTIDPECRSGQVCLNQRCVDEPDPCNPSPCGPGTTCSAPQVGGRYQNPVCRCKPGLIPNPDTITGCKPECVIDPDCSTGYVCENQRCVEKPDPCDPSPCGPGAVCMTNNVGNAICRCQPGLVPKPDTITGCGPECVIDPDCPGDFVCENQKCIERPDPCFPSPCGPGATCSVGPNGNPICRCEPGLIPNPDTITGCKPECVVDPDCGDRDYICENQKCVLKPDPCDPSPCGPGTMCMANKLGNPICRCLAGLVPKPDTITGCGPECTVDPDCNTGYICQNQKCVERPDPCNPNPCGPNAICMPQGLTGQFTCKCPPGFIGDARTSCIKAECQRNEDCAQDMACEDYNCINPCQTIGCEKDYFCKVIKHVATCGRKFVPVPQEPRDIFVIGESYNRGNPEPRTSQSSSNVFVIGSRHGGATSSTSGRTSTSGSPRSNSGTVIGAGYRRKRLSENYIPSIFYDYFL